MLQLCVWLVFSSAAEHRVSRTSEQKPPHVTTAVQTESVDGETDRDIVSPWTVPDDIQRILQDSHDSLFQVGCLLVLGMVGYLPLNACLLLLYLKHGSLLKMCGWDRCRGT